jgi:hypothetical protein
VSLKKEKAALFKKQPFFFRYPEKTFGYLENYFKSFAKIIIKFVLCS